MKYIGCILGNCVLDWTHYLLSIVKSALRFGGRLLCLFVCLLGISAASDWSVLLPGGFGAAIAPLHAASTHPTAAEFHHSGSGDKSLPGGFKYEFESTSLPPTQAAWFANKARGYANE